MADPDGEFGLDAITARRLSRQLIDIGESSIGLLVHVSTNELRYFHRSSQEYLAAEYLARRRLDKQLSVVTSHCADPHWREVLLALVSMTVRTDDIRQFIQQVSSKQATIVERFDIQLLLTEIACGEFSCPASTARMIVEDACTSIEQGTWMPHRERLLRLVLDGLRSAKVREYVKTKLVSWFPRRIQWLDGLYRAMAQWPLHSNVVHTLWLGLHAEAPNDHRAAAEALAKLAHGDEVIGTQIATLARTTNDPTVRAAALRCLLRGWPESLAVVSLISVEELPASPELQVCTIEALIQGGHQIEMHREALLLLGSSEGGLDYSWREDIAPLLNRGWPKHPQTKKACLAALRETAHLHSSVENAIAIQVLLEGYPNDDDVAQYCADQIAHEQFPFLSNHHEAWRLLFLHFKDHPLLIEAIDQWLPQQPNFRFAEVVYASLIGRTAVGKAKLLALLTPDENGSYTAIQWPVSVLLEYWGMDDPEVASAIMALVEGPAERVSQVAHLLPQIIKDQDECRSRLLELLRRPGRVRYTFVLEGLKQLAAGAPDPDVVDAVLHLSLDHSNYEHQDLLGSMLVNHATDPRMRKLALEELDRLDGLHQAVAYGFGQDEEIRAKITALGAPLPALLRERIASALEDSEPIGDDDFALGLLACYDAEPDSRVKTQASIAYHRRLRDSGQDLGEALKLLQRNLLASGFGLEERRLAAFSGLAVLHRLDIVRDVREPGVHQGFWSAVITHDLRGNVPFIRLVLQHWNDLKQTFGEEMLQILTPFGDRSPEYAWEMLLPFVDESPSAHEDADHYIEQMPAALPKPNTLRYIGQAQPKSSLLLEFCLSAIKVDLPYAWSETALVAAEILGAQFTGDPAVLTRLLEDELEGHVYEGQLISLCEGWPESDALERLFRHIYDQERRMSHALHVQLLSRKGTVGEIMHLFDRLGHPSLRTLHQRSATIPQPLVRRLREDNELLATLWERLRNRPTVAEKITFPYLISAAHGLSPELHAWCLQEIEQQAAMAGPPQIGLNLVTGGILSVSHTLFDVLALEMTAVSASLIVDHPTQE